ITLSHLMNSLDGLSTAEGVIVVATANDAGLLDDAILRRPGRFDRVVEFRNPGSELRARFIRKSLRNGCPEKDLDDMVRLSAGFSFAQLREAYVLAGQLAYEQGRDVAADDMHQALRLMREARRGGGGFAPEKLHVGYPGA
ncbi:MAG: AAA family ATPase, partial [Bryobacteraceae bacterium]